MNVLQPGEGLSDETRARMTGGRRRARRRCSPAQAPKAGIDLLIEIVPDNPLQAAADGDMLAVMFFSLMFGIGLSLTRTEAARRFEEVIEGLYDVTMRLIGMVIGLAPFGVAALLFTLTAAARLRDPRPAGALRRRRGAGARASTSSSSTRWRCSSSAG